MYKVFLHKLTDINGTEFYKISYTSKSIDEYVTSSKWVGTPELVWEKHFSVKVEAEAFKKTYRDQYKSGKYQSDIIKSSVDTFTSDSISDPESIEINEDYLEKLLEKHSSPVFVYLLDLEDGWFKVGTSNKSPKETYSGQAKIVWSAQVLEGREYANKFRDFVHNKCSSKRTTKGSVFAKCFQPSIDVTDIKALKTLWLTPTESTSEDFDELIPF